MLGVRLYLNIQFNVVLLIIRNKFKINEKINAKSIENNGIWNETAKGYEKISPF